MEAFQKSRHRHPEGGRDGWRGNGTLPRARDVERDYFACKAKFGDIEVPDAKCLRSLEEANARLERLLADTMLDNARLKNLPKKMIASAAKRQAVAQASCRRRAEADAPCWHFADIV